MTELIESEARLLAALTLQTMKRFGGDTLHVGEDNQLGKLRMVRIGNIALLE